MNHIEIKKKKDGYKKKVLLNSRHHKYANDTKYKVMDENVVNLLFETKWMNKYTSIKSECDVRWVIKMPKLKWHSYTICEMYSMKRKP